MYATFASSEKRTDLFKVWIARWVGDEVAGRSKYPLLQVGGGGLVPDFTREAAHRHQMRVLLCDEAPFQRDGPNTPASNLPDARSTHAVPQTDDPLNLDHNLGHADRMKSEQQDERKDSPAHTMYATLHSSDAWPAKTSWASWWVKEYDHETALEITVEDHQRS